MLLHYDDVPLWGRAASHKRAAFPLWLLRFRNICKFGALVELAAVFRPIRVDHPPHEPVIGVDVGPLLPAFHLIAVGRDRSGSFNPITAKMVARIPLI